MEEKSLRVYQQKTFFSRIGTTINKLLIPTKVGFNGVMITVKRNNMIKAYEGFKNFDGDDSDKKEHLNKKYEDTFALYLEAIDKYIMDSIYKKVKSYSATPFEEDALSKYYMITQLKEKQYLEYKYRKQKYLIDLDYENIKSSTKEKNLNKFQNFYVEKMDTLYKGILKNYSVQLADNVRTSANDKNEIFDKVFSTIEEYVLNVLALKINMETVEVNKDTLEQYDKYSKFLAGKPDSIDLLEKKMIILAISRKVFTHSLPLIVAEQCYEQLLNEIRSEIVHSRNERKTKKAYKMLLNIIEEYKINLLSTKIYWDNQNQKDEYKKFWNAYKALTSENKNESDINKEKEILFVRNEIEVLKKEANRYKLVINIYKKKLVELGVMKELKNNCHTGHGTYSKKKKKVRKCRKNAKKK